MSTLLSAPRRDTEALVVEHDPNVREQLVSALTRHGYGVRACDTLAEARRSFSHQAVVVTHANGDTAELRGFVNFVRQAAGSNQPYIVAVGEAGSPSGLSRDQLGLDAFMPVPIEASGLAAQMESIDRRLALAPPEPAPRAARELTPAAPPAMLAHFAPVLLDHMPQALAMFDTRMRYLAANRHFTSAFGLDSQDIVGRSHYELFPDLHANWRRLFDEALAGQTGRIEEDYFQRADGTSDWVRWEVRPWHEADGDIGGLVLSQEIVTDKKREERRRVFDRNLATSIFESQVLPLLLVGLDGRILRSSPAARAVLGLQPTADGRLPFWEVYPEREQEEEEQARIRALASPPNDGTLGGYQPDAILVPGQPPQWLHWSASPHRNAAGETQAILLLGTLIPMAQPETPPVPLTADPQPTVASEDLAHHVPFGLVQLDREGIVAAANEAVGPLLGRPLPVGSSFERWLVIAAPEPVLREPVVREWRDNVWRRQLARTFSFASEDGLLKEIEIRPRILPDGHLFLILSDVTETRRAEDALRTSEAKYRSLFRELPAGIALANTSGALVETNPALEQLTGYSRADLRRLTLADLVHFDLAPPETQAPNPRPASLLARNGSRQPVMVTQGAIRNPAGEPVLQACFFLPLPAPLPTTPAQPAEPAQPAAPADPSEPAADERAPWRELAFDHLRTAILVTDLRGRIRVANAAAARFFDTDPQELEGAALYRLFRPQDPGGFSREVSTSLNATKSWSRESTCHTIDGRSLGACRAEITPVQDAAVPGLICLLQPVFAPAHT